MEKIVGEASEKDEVSSLSGARHENGVSGAGQREGRARPCSSERERLQICSPPTPAPPQLSGCLCPRTAQGAGSQGAGEKNLSWQETQEQGARSRGSPASLSNTSSTFFRNPHQIGRAHV